MLIRMSDRVRFCDRELVAAGALQAITVDLRLLRANRNRAAPRSEELERNILFEDVRRSLRVNYQAAQLRAIVREESIAG
jgi:hypothetical protein